MEKLNKPELPSIIFDSDVIISWLTKETETKTGEELWKAPLKIITLIGSGVIKGWVSITSILEIRFILRRKKKCTEDAIKLFFKDFSELFEIVIPDEVELLRSDNLQNQFFLDPFDAILLATALTRENIVLISRDKAFLSTAAKLLEATTPEDFLKERFPSS